MQLYFVGGMSGVGKTTLLESVARCDGRVGIIKGSTYFMQWLGIAPGDYTTLRSLPHDLKDRELDKMMRNLIISPPVDAPIVLFDGHYYRIYQGNVSSATGEWLSLFSGLILVTGNAEEVLRRIDREQDKKIRALFPITTSHEEQLLLLQHWLAMTRTRVEELSRLFGLPYSIVYNKEGQHTLAVKGFLTAFSSMG